MYLFIQCLLYCCHRSQAGLTAQRKTFSIMTSMSGYADKCDHHSTGITSILEDLQQNYMTLHNITWRQHNNRLNSPHIQPYETCPRAIYCTTASNLNDSRSKDSMSRLVTWMTLSIYLINLVDLFCNCNPSSTCFDLALRLLLTAS